MATRDEIKALLAIVAAAYGDKFKLSPKTVDVYADLLGDLDIDTLKAATRQHIATGEWPPTVADLRRGVTVLDVPALPDWGEAWAELLREIGRVGYCGTPTWSSPVVAEAVRQFGTWGVICAMEIDDTATHRAQFRQIFEGVTSRAHRTAALLPDVRALAVERGALPAPVEDVPALPAPEPVSDEPPAPSSVVRGGTRSYADFRRCREEQRAEREAAGRAALRQWQESQGVQDAAQ